MATSGKLLASGVPSSWLSRTCNCCGDHHRRSRICTPLIHPQFKKKRSLLPMFLS
ncbi:hypothetical protein L873DRAFT_1808314 [Choiromyces venosus 120613-1]|uniref:Uncharacterized protein n=1 Tax=Choiromyces venosus 120613-1 TaxID=1336337 RepID=A0A3N4JJF8_9PEZI|nr:hypothetical protein L873DRAFT_1808314 [Choiromyces venosus 120613-1]